jgi:hypothetical protein
MKLCNYADGIKGHYCIGRKMDPKSIYWEYYNKGKWCSAGEVFDWKNGRKMITQIKEVTK